MYECEFCHKTFSVSKHWKDHVRIHTGEKPYQCNRCSYTSNQSANLATHRRKQPDGPVFSCPDTICDFTSCTKKGLELHLKTEHDQRYPAKGLLKLLPDIVLQSPGSRRKAPTERLNNRSSVKRSISRKVPRPITAPSVPSKQERESPVEPEQSGVVSIQSSSDQLPKDEHNHYLCRFCDFRTKHAENVKRHERLHTGEKPYKCDRCSYASNQTGNLATHFRIRGDGPPSRCSFCSFSSCTRKGLRIHETTEHNIPSPKKKLAATTVFKSQEELVQFLDKEDTDDEEPEAEDLYYSPVRNGFDAADKLNSTDLPEANEVEVREGSVVIYPCPYCDFISQRAESVVRHVRLHTGEKPFACQYCAYRAVLKWMVTVHERTHTGLKPYVCAFCSKAFAQLSTLNGHMKTHSSTLQAASVGAGSSGRAKVVKKAKFMKRRTGSSVSVLGSRGMRRILTKLRK